MIMLTKDFLRAFKMIILNLMIRITQSEQETPILVASLFLDESLQDMGFIPSHTKAFLTGMNLQRNSIVT